ncbi:phosphoribosylformylglycinamidine synthase subunit PurQ, partial [Serratia marcescens]|nr:phosphoribosylformylglycinamidine synthase subunit PurQ [Serratia marcescens]
GEGHVEVRDAASSAALESHGSVALRFVNNAGQVTETYPANLNGSPNGITAVASASRRATVMMPHLERVFERSATRRPEEWGEDSPWMRMFRNARSNWAKYGHHRTQGASNCALFTAEVRRLAAVSAFCDRRYFSCRQMETFNF